MSIVIPEQMRALVVHSLDEQLKGCAIEVVPVPEPKIGEALIKVRAAAINFPDILMTRGDYQFKPALPFILGSECAGQVVAVGGNATPHWVGQSVIAVNRHGMIGEYAVAPVASLRSKPDALNWAEASAYRAVYLTAYVALVRRANIQPGEWVLVHGAAGGTGLACVDLAKQLGARVIAASSSLEKLTKVQALFKPDAIIDIRNGFRDQVKTITGGRGADIIFDPVGGDVFDESTRCIAFDGRLLVIGFTSGRIASVATNIPLIKGFSVVGVRAGEYARQFPERGAENLAAIDMMAQDGHIRPHIHAVLPLARWREAMAMLLDRKAVGKVVLTPDERY